MAPNDVRTERTFQYPLQPPFRRDFRRIWHRLKRL